jgi:hypothetical protein
MIRNPGFGRLNRRGRVRPVLALLMAAPLLLVFAGSALGHWATSISGTVDCSGNWSVTVHGAVWDPVHLWVKVGDAPAIDEGTQGTDQSERTFGPFKGTGGTAGDAISAWPSDDPGANATGKLVADPAVCTGSVKIVKVISSTDKGPGFDWAFNLSGPGTDKDTGVGTTSDLAFGAYAVNEVNIPDNYKWVSTVCEPNVEDSAKVASAPNVAHLSADAPNWTCTVTNSYNPPPPTGSITFVKVVSGDNKGPATPADWRFNIDPPNKDVMVGTQDGLALGDYHVQEVNIVPGYKWVSTDCQPNQAPVSDVKVSEVSNPVVTVALSTDALNWTCTFTNAYDPAPPTAPKPPALTCGGTASFTDVPEGWKLVIEPGDILVTSGFDKITLAPGDYTYQWRTADNQDIVTENGGGKFTIADCQGEQTPTPTPSGTAEAATGTPVATPPSTDSISSNGSGTGTGLLLVLLVLSAASLAVVPASRRRTKRS